MVAGPTHEPAGLTIALCFRRVFPSSDLPTTKPVSSLTPFLSFQAFGIMDAQLQPRQPNLPELAQCLENAAREVSRLPNVPAFNQGNIIIAQLQNIIQAIGDLRTEVSDLRTEMGARFDAK